MLRNPHHLLEWSQSCVAEEVTHLNVTSLEGHQALEHLLYDTRLPRRNDGRLCDSLLQRYQHLFTGGWWCSGIDILTGKEDTWGCFKPIQPRYSRDRDKPIKYEHPPQVPTGIFALRVSLPIWQRIADRHNLTLTSEDIQPHQPDLGFWQWVLDHPSLPLCITEGAKKAGALLSAGYAAIALPGVNGGYRTPRDSDGNRIGKSRLIPQLQKLATPQREIYLVFDQDSKPATLRAVNTAIQQTGYLLTQVGCIVKVITWNPTLGKGVDDLIAVQGQPAFDEAWQNAPLLAVWKAQSWQHLTYSPDLELNCRYLPPLPIPTTAKLIAIKSPKGTGKTQLLEGIVKAARDRGQWVLVIGHRVRLVEALCQRFGLKYVTWGLGTGEASPQSENLHPLPSHLPPYPGFGLCIDSLHPRSQAQFRALDWSDGVVIIDEVEQVLWHALNSSTCTGQRVAILKSLKTLMQNVLGGSGQVFVADADLSDLSIDYLKTLAGVPLDPYVIVNNWQPGKEQAWTVYNYGGASPKQLLRDLEEHIRNGGKPFVCLSAQKPKSLWGTCNLEAYLREQFPQAKILRIDSESLADPDHPACGCMGRLDRVLPNYDIVLASPSLETGVSLELQGHFTSVWAIAVGVQSENSVRQALGRIRENLPRYIWAAVRGLNPVGNGSTSIPSLLRSGERLTQLNIRLLQQSDFATLDDLEVGFQAESLLCWAKMAVRLNRSMQRYRESVVAALAAEGHRIIEEEERRGGERLGDEGVMVPSVSPSAIQAQITTVREQNYQAECEAVAEAQELSPREYRVLKRQVMKTATQRRSLRKYELQQRYCIPVTAELVAKDEGGWYERISLHYFLTAGRPYLGLRDATVARCLIEGGEGQIFLPDFNRSQLGAAIGTLELLGIPALLQNSERELRNVDGDLKAMATLALRNRSAIKAILGIGLALNASPVAIVGRFLSVIGYNLKYLRIESYEKKRVRVYQVTPPNDDRFTVFQQWLELEGRCRSKTLSTPPILSLAVSG
ncbi:MAG: plasmid replication protein, CyRepA1 family [Actinomycetota bacterium]